MSVSHQVELGAACLGRARGTVSQPRDTRLDGPSAGRNRRPDGEVLSHGAASRCRSWVTIRFLVLVRLMLMATGVWVWAWV
jgi:hypothetical protein